MTSRGQRHTREELRQLLLETGRTILREEGLGTGAEGLTFKRVFDRVENETGVRLTNASVIRRVWDNQVEFQTDVLMTIALDENEDEIDSTVKAVEPVLAAVDRSSPASRQEALRELCRLGGAANIQAVRRSSNWPSWIGVWALAAAGQPREDRKKVESALLAGYDTFTQRIEAVYEAMAEYLGLRLREHFTLRQFSIATDSLGQGYGLRDRIDDSTMEVVIRPTGPGGAEQEWTPFAVAFEGLVLQFFEIDPAWVPEGRGPRQE